MIKILAVASFLFIALISLMLWPKTDPIQTWLIGKKDVLQPIGSLAIAFAAFIVSAAQLQIKNLERKEQKQVARTRQILAYDVFLGHVHQITALIKKYNPDQFSELMRADQINAMQSINNEIIAISKNQLITEVDNLYISCSALTSGIEFAANVIKSIPENEVSLLKIINKGQWATLHDQIILFFSIVDKYALENLNVMPSKSLPRLYNIDPRKLAA